MDTSGLYHRVMEGVLTRSKKEFAAEHLSENVLNRLAVLWEEKLLGAAKIDVGKGKEQHNDTSRQAVQKVGEDKRSRSPSCVDTSDAPRKRNTLSVNEKSEKQDGHDSRAEEFTLSSESEEELRDYNLESADVLLGQFEKVSRTKSKWKCFLKDGIITVDGKDLAFSRAVGEFRWA